jgi:hypothetical protein
MDTGRLTKEETGEAITLPSTWAGRMCVSRCRWSKRYLRSEHLRNKGKIRAVRACYRKSEEEETRLVEEATKDVMTTLRYREESVSAGDEEDEPKDWNTRL